MTDTLSTEALLGMLSEAAAARDWALYIDYEPRDRRWRAWTGHAHAGGDGAGATAQEALADCWVQVQRHCREAATRGAG